MSTATETLPEWVYREGTPDQLTPEHLTGLDLDTGTLPPTGERVVRIQRNANTDHTYAVGEDYLYLLGDRAEVERAARIVGGDGRIRERQVTDDDGVRRWLVTFYLNPDVNLHDEPAWDAYGKSLHREDAWRFMLAQEVGSWEVIEGTDEVLWERNA